ncbi:30S ribosomal protein S8e [archaeon]|jgi:small subunit ribosomal protein S8e|nr:30S ribosomal protein S8e [archaeon]MBT6824285.1 30S ribosomal protein S8e [archaeon]MBT7107363.1 30S ribosomal protein S8e [archaeon]MBT7297329.1 30S ribosomal protein S8e [archaeon]
MAISQDRSKKKASGSRYIPLKKKKQYELGRQPTLTKVGEKKRRSLRTMSGKKKEILLVADTVNLYDQKTKKFSKIKIESVIESDANRHYVRRNILTKGAIVETTKGKARITSRPGQEGSINAVLIKE